MTSPAPKPPLDGIRVIDATTRWGEMAGRVLAELGAEVVKIEPPGGCDSRRLAPFDGWESLYWACVGAGKKSVVAGEVGPFLADADVFIESGRCGDLSRDYPGLVHVSVTPFGTTGPLAGEPAAEVTVEAAGGLVGLQGDRDRPPLPMGAMPQAAFHAGVQAAADILIALYEREQSALGQHLDVSAQACIVWTLMNATGFPPNVGRNPPGTGEFRGQLPPAAAEQRLKLPGTVPCRDGLVQVRFQMRLIGERTFNALLRWVEASGMDVPDGVRGLDLNAWLAALRLGELDTEAAQTAADLIVVLLATKTKQENPALFGRAWAHPGGDPHGSRPAPRSSTGGPGFLDRRIARPRRGRRRRATSSSGYSYLCRPLRTAVADPALTESGDGAGIVRGACPTPCRGGVASPGCALRRTQGGRFQLGRCRPDGG